MICPICWHPLVDRLMPINRRSTVNCSICQTSFGIDLVILHESPLDEKDIEEWRKRQSVKSFVYDENGKQQPKKKVA